MRAAVVFRIWLGVPGSSFGWEVASGGRLERQGLGFRVHRLGYIGFRGSGSVLGGSWNLSNVT